MATVASRSLCIAVLAMCLSNLFPGQLFPHTLTCSGYSTCSQCLACYEFVRYHCTEDAAETYFQCVADGEPEEMCWWFYENLLFQCQSSFETNTASCRATVCSPAGGGGEPIGDTPIIKNLDRKFGSPSLSQILLWLFP